VSIRSKESSAKPPFALLITSLHAAGRDSQKGLHRFFFIKIASENPFLWTGMKDASAESRKNKSDAETSSALHDGLVLVFLSSRTKS